MEEIAIKGTMTLFEYGAVGVMLVITVAALYFVIKKQVYDNAKIMSDISSGMTDISSSMSELTKSAQEKDSLLMELLRDMRADNIQTRKERDDCLKELSGKMEEHNIDSKQGISNIMGAIKKLEDGFGCELQQNQI